MIYDAAKASGESAYSIIVKIFQEIGNGTELPDMISGTDSEYPNTYNFFNYGANDGDNNKKNCSKICKRRRLEHAIQSSSRRGKKRWQIHI